MEKGATGSSVPHRDVDALGDALWLRADQVDGKQAVLQIRTHHLHAVGKEESALELASCDTAMQEDSGFVVHLPSTDDELVFFDRDVEFLAAEAGDGECDSQPLRRPVAGSDPLDIIGRIAVIGGFGDPVQSSFDLIEAEQKG